MTGHGTQLGPKKREAIEALIRSDTVEEAARAIGTTAQTLGRWQKESQFDAEYRAARRAGCRHATVRKAQGAPAALRSTAQIMYKGKRPADRLKAAQDIFRLAQEAVEFYDLAAAVTETERVFKASQKGRPPMTGHGAKFPRKKEQAIAALLLERSIPEAARAVPIGVTTIYQWLQDPVFCAAYAAAATAVFGPAMMIAHHRMDDAITTIRNLSVDLTIPESIRLQANRCVTDGLMDLVQADVVSRVSAMEPAEADAGEPQSMGRRLHQQLERIKTSCQTTKPAWLGRMILVHSVDGRPAGSSVKGPDGRHLWVVPPEGCKKGDPVEEHQDPVQESAA
jgi:hypothetical protein